MPAGGTFYDYGQRFLLFWGFTYASRRNPSRCIAFSAADEKIKARTKVIFTNVESKIFCPVCKIYFDKRNDCIYNISVKAK